MKKITFYLLTIGMIVGVTNKMNAQESASANAEATIVAPITIAKTVDMNFGTVAVQETNPGTVVLTPAGARTSTLGVTLPTVTGTVAAAAFNVAGQGSYTFTIDLPDSIVLTDGASDTMTVNTFTSNGVAATGDTTAALTTGAFALNVGATLNVAASQEPGVYTGSFTVTVNYN